jgi:hypothetical protein
VRGDYAQADSCGSLNGNFGDNSKSRTYFAKSADFSAQKARVKNGYNGDRSAKFAISILSQFFTKPMLDLLNRV